VPEVEGIRPPALCVASSARTTSTLAQAARSTSSATAPDRRRVGRPGRCRAVRLEQLEQPLVAERGHLDGLAERGPDLALGSVRSSAMSMMIGDGLVERPDEVLALGRSTPVLPPIDESIWATRVVGTWIDRTPRR
jgi:hypothetical protein